PSVVWIVDTKKEHIAVGEARKLGIPVVAVLDTNCDPDEVDYKIPGNDDAIRSAALLTRVVADAVADGLMARQAAQSAGSEGADNGAAAEIGANEPLAEWERELLEGTKPADQSAAPPAASANGAGSAPASTAAPADASPAAAEAPASDPTSAQSDEPAT
ncbi:MAG: 30S ribosomal protein S2, partial [Actinomycetota bacterium]|nr:30S ribosomal protein S2 [Actinomycetota bacterium]